MWIVTKDHYDIWIFNSKIRKLHVWNEYFEKKKYHLQALRLHKLVFFGMGTGSLFCCFMTSLNQLPLSLHKARIQFLLCKLHKQKRSLSCTIGFTTPGQSGTIPYWLQANWYKLKLIANGCGIKYQYLPHDARLFSTHSDHLYWQSLARLSQLCEKHAIHELLYSSLFALCDIRQS